MLNFSRWKVTTIAGVLLIGLFLALPNALSNGFMGVAPDQPRSQSPDDLRAFQAQTDAASQAWWPGFLPSKKVKLGLDLQGGVYLLLEIDPDEVVANQMEVVQRDVSGAIRGTA
ncbi:MAG: protein translocase subunit SecD, partial [Pseudomonadota bacterium]